MPLENRTAFAARLGVNKSTVTRWAQTDRLVLTDDGQIDVEPSLRKLEATQGVLPAHAANRERLAEARRQDQPAPEPDLNTGAAVTTDDALTKIGVKTKFDAWRKIKADADRAELERDLQLGRVVPKDDVRKDLTDATAIILGHWETLPDRIAPVLVGIDDQARIRAVLRDEIEQLNQRVAEELAAVGNPNTPTDLDASA